MTRCLIADQHTKPETMFKPILARFVKRILKNFCRFGLVNRQLVKAISAP